MRLQRFFFLGGLVLCALLFTGCVSFSPELEGTPTPTASPTPMPEPFQLTYSPEPQPTDLLGKAIVTEDHYYRYYITPGDLRVYEYDTGTFLDGIVVNGYPLPLSGTVRVAYYEEKTGRICGAGVLHTREGSTVFKSGSNVVYAEIETDTDVRMMDFVLEVTVPFAPVTEENASGEKQ